MRLYKVSLKIYKFKGTKKIFIRKNNYINSTFCNCTFSNIDISNNEFEGCIFRRMTSSKDYESILKAKLHLCMGLYLNCPEEGSFIGYKKNYIFRQRCSIRSRR